MKRQFRYKYFLLGLILLITFFVYIECQSLDDYNEFLEEQNLFLLRERNRITKAQWSHDSNITNFNEINLIEKANAFDEFRKKQAKLVEEYRRTNVTEPLPESLRRQFDKLGFLGVSVLDEIDREQWQASLLRMEKIYSSSKIKLDEDEDSNEINDDYRDGLPLQPDLTQIMATSTDEPLLRKIWQKFRDATGKRIRDDYLKYIDLGNKAAQKLDKGFESYDDIWVSDWNMENFREEMERLINEVMPLYRKIHAYVRFHLNRTYPGVIPKDGTIPAHLLGNMWAQHWSNLLQLIPEMQFFPDVPSIDGAVNEKLQNLTVKEMFQLSEEFFHSLGMRNMTRTFWNRSILERPKGIEMIWSPCISLGFF
ncbi:hypothetical protein SSS_02397 [Sarcoptes scabiei]|nr:hypothetical protein SSS_02397 [Sarcoptes scabiei]